MKKLRNKAKLMKRFSEESEHVTENLLIKLKNRKPLTPRYKLTKTSYKDKNGRRIRNFDVVESSGFGFGLVFIENNIPYIICNLSDDGLEKIKMSYLTLRDSWNESEVLKLSKQEYDDWYTEWN